MTTIRTFLNPSEAEFYVTLLRGNGFEAALLDEAQQQAAFLSTGIRLQVLDQEAEEALKFLESAPPPGDLPPAAE